MNLFERLQIVTACGITWFVCAWYVFKEITEGYKAETVDYFIAAICGTIGLMIAIVSLTIIALTLFSLAKLIYWTATGNAF